MDLFGGTLDPMGVPMSRSPWAQQHSKALFAHAPARKNLHSVLRTAFASSGAPGGLHGSAAAAGAAREGKPKGPLQGGAAAAAGEELAPRGLLLGGRGAVPISRSPWAKLHCPGSSRQVPASQNLQIERRTGASPPGPGSAIGAAALRVGTSSGLIGGGSLLEKLDEPAAVPISCSPCAKVHCGPSRQEPSCQNLQMVRRIMVLPSSGSGSSSIISPGTVPISCSPCAKVHMSTSSRQDPDNQNLQIVRRTGRSASALGGSTRCPVSVPNSCSPCANEHCPGNVLHNPACQNLQSERRTSRDGSCST
mmetsp:Transcript_73805/g.207998  ORF Transcript_73805/g.207998 Transcript_73805/m.207998 type:complete len:307 (-) Transcript_73805:196-1116(-)